MAAPTYQPTQGGSSVPEELKELVRKGKDARAPFERDWFLNLAFFKGDQWCWWNRGRIERPDTRTLPENTVLLVENRIAGAVRTEVAKKTKQNPVWVSTPSTADEEDVNAAILGEQVAVDRWLNLKLSRKLRTGLNWATICTAGFWKVYWDPEAGDGFEAGMMNGEPFTDPRTGRPMAYDQLPPQVQESAQRQKVSQGDVCVEVRSPFEIIPDPLAESLDECEWIIEESVRSPEYLLRRYNKLVEPDTNADAGVSESRMFGGGWKQGDGYKGVKVWEYWAKPSSKFPNGKRCVWTKDTLLAEDQQPFDCMPYVMFSGIPVPGQFWPTSIVSMLRGPQTELNKTISQIAQNRNRFGNPAMMIDKMADPVNYTGVPGEVIKYNGTTQNSVPAYLIPPEMPSYVLQSIDRNQAAMREISMQQEVANGSVPPGITAASAINLLLEQYDTLLGPETQEMEASLGDAGTKILKLVARYYDDTRTVRIAGEEGAWTIKDFRGAMLNGNTTIEVQTGSMAPKSQAAKQAAGHDILNLLIQNGIPLDQRSLAQFLKDSEVGGLERFIEQYTANETQINRENRQMSNGTGLSINSYDDDHAHVSGHEEYQKSSGYENLDPSLKQLFEQHTAEHRQRIQDTQMAAQQAANPQMPLPGMEPQQPPSGAGGPPQ